MNILITGANGFIGAALADKLTEQDHIVTGTFRQTIDKSNPDVCYHQISEIDDTTDWSHILTDIDCVIHLAARTHILHETEIDPLAIYSKINKEGTLNLARQAAQQGVRRFIFISSIKVNGEEQQAPYTEYQLVHPTEPYALSKWEAEQGLLNLSLDTYMDVVILRPPLVYGPGVKANFAHLIKVINRGWPLPFAMVKNKRSFVFLENLISAIIASISHPAAANQTFLVSDMEKISTPDLIRIIASELSQPVRLFPVPVLFLKVLGSLLGKQTLITRLTDSLTVDNRKICTTLDWSPPFTLEQGLKKTIQAYKNIKHARP